jgi:hypothetical protein
MRLVIKEAIYYSRMAWHYGRFALSKPPVDYRRTLLDNTRRRDERFLALVKPAIFDNPRTPFHHLLRWAGCEFEDLRAMVQADGLESALKKLHDSGVYMSNAENKGAPITRGSQTFAYDSSATRNPASPNGMETTSSGSRSHGLATNASNEYRLYRSQYEKLFIDENVPAGSAVVTMQFTLPAPGGLLFSTILAMYGMRAEKWFATRGPFYYRAATAALVWEGRMLGRAIPMPEYLPQNDYGPVARWIAAAKRSGRPTFLRGNASACTRVAAAALQAGLDIAGTVCEISGEAITDAKREIYGAAGMRAYPRYVVSEVGTLGAGCPHLSGNSVHVYGDSVAIISYRRPAPLLDTEVDSLLLTSTNPIASRVYINLEVDDGGDIGAANCGCLHSQLGYTRVIRNVHSFGKLTGHSTTLVGTDIVRLLEAKLPARFGGAPGDYQLVERQGAAQVEMKLRVSPRAGVSDTAAVRTFFLDEVRTVFGGAVSLREWEHSGNFEVIVAEPLRTRTGKVLSLDLAGLRGRDEA